MHEHTRFKNVTGRSLQDCRVLVKLWWDLFLSLLRRVWLNCFSAEARNKAGLNSRCHHAQYSYCSTITVNSCCESSETWWNQAPEDLAQTLDSFSWNEKGPFDSILCWSSWIWKNCLQYSQLDRFGKALHLLMEALEANAEARRIVPKLIELHRVARCRKFGFACQAVGPNSSLASLRFRHDSFLLERGVSWCFECTE